MVVVHFKITIILKRNASLHAKHLEQSPNHYHSNFFFSQNVNAINTTTMDSLRSSHLLCKEKQHNYVRVYILSDVRIYILSAIRVYILSNVRIYILSAIRVYNFNLYYSMSQWMIAFTSHHDSNDNIWKEP
jgi:hypothetical protein